MTRETDEQLDRLWKLVLGMGEYVGHMAECPVDPVDVVGTCVCGYVTLCRRLMEAHDEYIGEVSALLQQRGATVPGGDD